MSSGTVRFRIIVIVITYQSSTIDIFNTHSICESLQFYSFLCHKLLLTSREGVELTRYALHYLTWYAFDSTVVQPTFNLEPRSSCYLTNKYRPAWAARFSNPFQLWKKVPPHAMGQK